MAEQRLLSIACLSAFPIACYMTCPMAFCTALPFQLFSPSITLSVILIQHHVISYSHRALPDQLISQSIT